MPQKNEVWISKVTELHNCLSVALFQQLAKTKWSSVDRRALLRELLNDIDRMDEWIDAEAPSLDEYRVQCRDFFMELDEALLATLMIEQARKTLGLDHFFIKQILPSIKINWDSIEWLYLH